MKPIAEYGKYKSGLTNAEIKQYLWDMGRNQGFRGYSKKDLFNKFCEVAGPGNTGVVEDGKPLMYRHDVERFARKMFFNTPTYWD